MLFLVLKAYLKLIHFDWYLARGNFAVLYDKVRNYPVAAHAPAPEAIGFTRWYLDKRFSSRQRAKDSGRCSE